LWHGFCWGQTAPDGDFPARKELLSMSILSAAPLILITLGMFQSAQPRGTGHSPTYTIKLAEMSDDLAVFEVFLPAADARRKGVVHKVLDDGGTVIATEKFGTANGHYKVAMIGSYFAGRSYRFQVDGKYELKFVFNPTS